jgi:probable blue pigment (indigoidine) exporter
VLLTGEPSIARRDVRRLILAAACWGFGTVVSKAALDEVPPLTLLPIQLAVSLLLLAVLMWSEGIPLRGDGPPLLGRLGLLNPGLAYALGLIGLVTITASVYVLLWALEPILILILAVVFLRERVTAVIAALSMLAIAGVALIVYDPSAGTSQLVGVGLTLAGIACCAAYTVITRRYLPGVGETSQVVISQQAHALGFALVVVVLIAVVGGSWAPATFSIAGLASAVLSGALYYAGAYWFYLAALKNVPASIASASFYLIPIVGVTAGALLLGERLEPRQWVGAFVVIGAVIGIVRPRMAVALT